jgi:hypothetical protein
VGWAEGGAVCAVNIVWPPPVSAAGGSVTCAVTFRCALSVAQAVIVAMIISAGVEMLACRVKALIGAPPRWCRENGTRGSGGQCEETNFLPEERLPRDEEVIHRQPSFAGAADRADGERRLSSADVRRNLMGRA